MPRPTGFRFFSKDGHSVTQFWEAILGSAAHDQGADSRIFQVFSRIFGPAAPDSPVHEFGPVFQFVRPPIDTVTTAADDLQGRSDDTIVITFGRATETPGDGAATVITGPDNVPEGADAGRFTVQVELPWPLACGLAPITADSASQAKREPSGWLETFLDQQAKLSPLSVAFGAEGFGDVAADPPPWEAWGGPARGLLELSGDFSAGFTLTAMSFDVDRIMVQAGNDYVLVANDNFVGPGESLSVDATALGADDSMMFDGMAETDGRFFFTGGSSDDFFFGGAGADWVEGRGGADVLSGGGGSDVFVYRAPSDSTGTDYDTLADFDPGADRIDLPGAVAGFGAAVEGGALSTATFNDDLAAALGDLGASQAVWFAPDAGDLAGQVFLIVDGNGRSGYQEGEDYVFAVAGSPLADLTGHTDIFI